MMSFDNCFLFSHQPSSFSSSSSFDWDPHSFGPAGDLIMPPLDMESPVSSEAPTGYLQDAVAGWSDGCKRRRIGSPCPRDHDPAALMVTEDLQDLFQGFWDSNCHEDPLDNLSYMVQDDNTSAFSDDHLGSFMPLMWNSNKEEIAPKLQHELLSSPSSSSQGKDTHETRDSKANSPPSSTLKALPLKERETERRAKKAARVVYPFAVVKPGGLEGDVTLADINERILMRPTRPVRHPVGEFAGGPCVSADGPGLSGKEVVGLTRIHTQGRGTITIIRTRG